MTYELISINKHDEATHTHLGEEEGHHDEPDDLVGHGAERLRVESV